MLDLLVMAIEARGATVPADERVSPLFALCTSAIDAVTLTTLTATKLATPDDVLRKYRRSEEELMVLKKRRWRSSCGTGWGGRPLWKFSKRRC